MPIKINVSFSDAFLQPNLQPANARAFVNSVRSIRLFPLIELERGEPRSKGNE